VFKKAARGKANMRKRDRPAAEDDEGGSADAADAGATSTSSLSLMRELQKQRQRAKGVTLEVKSAVEEGEAAGEAEDAEDHGLENTFTAQKDGGEVDPNMLKYIEEQMQRQGGEGGDRPAGGPVDDEDGLYVTPAHLIGKVQSTEAAELEDANRWLAGIQEVAVSAEEKMANIEQTEVAKRKMMLAKANKPDKSKDWKIAIPGNYNSNFHLHRREFSQVAKGRGRGRGGRGRGGEAPTGSIPVASDGARMESFRRNEMNRRR